MADVPLPSSLPPALPAEAIRRATGDFPRRHAWVRAFTVLNGVAVLLNAVALNLVGLAFSGVLLMAAVSAWRATTLFTAAHESGNKAALHDALEQLEAYFRVSTVALMVGLGLGVLVLLLLLVAVALLGVGLAGLAA